MSSSECTALIAMETTSSQSSQNDIASWGKTRVHRVGRRGSLSVLKRHGCCRFAASGCAALPELAVVQLLSCGADQHV